MARMAILDRVLRKFGYDAIKDNKRRRAPRSTNYSEDNTLPAWQRNKLTATVRDVQRNFSVASWAIRKHLDYVSTFSFQAKTGDPDLNRRVEELMAWWSQPRNCDVRKQHSLARFIRLAEQSRTIDGDVFIVRLRTGQLQAVESDRVKDPSSGQPPNLDLSNTVQGVMLDKAGAPRGYIINKRSNTYSGSLTFEKVVRAANTFHLGYYDRFDQVRGISRLAAAINTYQDLYEGLTYALCKAKVSQLFGLVTYRDADSALGSIDSEVDDQGHTEYEIDFGVGPFHLDLDEGDKAEILESKNPSKELQDFSGIMIALALKALDIPMSFYQENFSNYSGSRQALLQYEQSAQVKRQDVRDLLDWVTAWKIREWIRSGILQLPAGMDERSIRWDWVGHGLPWIDPLKEVSAQVKAIEAGIMSRQEVAKSQGKDWFDIQEQLAEEKRIMGGADVDAPFPGGVNNAE